MNLHALFGNKNTEQEYSVTQRNDISHIGSNKIIGDTSLLDDADRLSIVFKGSGNILCLEKGIKHLRCLEVTFSGDNSLIYISKSRSEYNMIIEAESDSVFFIGPNMYTSKMKALKAKVRQGDMILTGTDCLLSLAIELDTLSMDGNSHGDLLIENHVWIGQNARIYGHSMIHSGAVIGAQTVIDGRECSGNACWVTKDGMLTKLREEVVFTKDSMRAVSPDALDSFDYIREDLRKQIIDMKDSGLRELADSLHGIKTASSRLKYINRTAQSRIQTRAPQLSEYVEWGKRDPVSTEVNGNRIIGDFDEAEGNSVVFEGSGNVLFIEPGAKLKDCRIHFYYDNSLVYLSRNDTPYHLRLLMHYNSTVYFGENIHFSERSPLRVNASEAKNVLIGNDVSFGKRVWIRTSDQHPVYDIDSGQRINKARSVVIGPGAKIKSDTVIRKGSVITSRKGQTAEHLSKALEELEKATTPEGKLSIMKLL